jgi:GntR family galactonate operon transcriptional repressor
MGGNLDADFKTYLLENDFKPGSRLDNELELAERFHVSRGTIREVLMHLQSLGVIERIKNKGTYIREFTYGKLAESISFCFQFSGFGFDELKEARLYLELSIVPLLVKRITHEQAEQLKQNIRQTEKHINSAEKADALDREFHVKLFDISGNRILKIFSNVINLLFRRQYRGKFLNPKAKQDSIKEHKALLEAIMADVVAGASEIIRKHISRT